MLYCIEHILNICNVIISQHVKVVEMVFLLTIENESKEREREGQRERWQENESLKKKR